MNFDSNSSCDFSEGPLPGASVRVVLQRVSEASVSVGGGIVGEIGLGFLILLGIEHEDTAEDIEWLIHKILPMRVFEDDEGKMNRSLIDVGGSVLVVSQFTLYARTRKGTRPSFDRAARPEAAIPLYQNFIEAMTNALGKSVATGEFGATMQVALKNDGPVTILLDSRQKE